MRAAKGIEVRHQRSCASRTNKRCDCVPTYRAYVDDPATKQRIRRTFDTIADAKRWREDANVDLRRGVISAAGSPKLQVIADEWLAGVRRGTIRTRSGRTFKPGTIRNYAQALKDHVIPELGDIRLSDLRRAHVQNLVDELVDTDLSPSGVRNALMPLRGICRRALIRGDLTTNPTHGLELPAVVGTRDRVASAVEATGLLSTLPVADRAIWGAAFYAGLRIGELRALQWIDVDYPRRLLFVRHNWDRVEGLIEPKSAAGLRVVPITAALRALMPDRPPGARDVHLVFGRQATVPFSPSGVVDRAHRLWKAAGQTAINPHECRHTFASFMIAAGVNIKALQVFMGHASITVTLDRYGHLMPGSEDQAGGLLDAYLTAQTASPCGTDAGQTKPGLSPLQPA